MHFYGTYAMARAAGFDQKSSTIIANSSEFVDNHASNEFIKFNEFSEFVM